MEIYVFGDLDLFKKINGYDIFNKRLKIGNI
jgi:hypothetical protein